MRNLYFTFLLFVFSATASEAPVLLIRKEGNLQRSSSENKLKDTEHSVGRVTGNGFTDTIEDTYLFYAKKLETQRRETKRVFRDDLSASLDSTQKMDVQKIIHFIERGGIEAIDSSSERIGRYEASRVCDGKLLVNIQVFQTETSLAADIEYRIQYQLLEATDQLSYVDELN